MKYMILSFLMLLTQAVSAQTIRDSQNQSDSLSFGEIFYLGEQNDAQKATIKIKTNETTTQRHDGNDVFKTNRVVEYSIKRHLPTLSSAENNIDCRHTVEYRDYHHKAFSKCNFQIIKRNIETWQKKHSRVGAQENTMLHIKQERPCCISHRQVSFGWRKHRRKNMGTITKFNNMTETLLCKEKSEQPCLDNIKSIITSTALTSTNKLEGSHHIELEEVINIEDKAIVKK